MTAALSSTVTLTFQDGVEQRVAVAAGQTVLEAGLAANVPLLFQCRSGSCTSCVGRLVSGQAQMRSGSASALLKAEQEAGQRLLCLTEPKGDCAIALDYASTLAGSGPVRANAFVNRVEQIADDAVRLELELAEGDWLDFQPGQFVQVKVPGTDQWRRYSMASAPAQLPKLELLVRLLPGGVMSDYLRNRARPDDVLEVEGPFGNFFLRDAPQAQHIMIAGGTGLAPMMSMVDVLRARPGRKPPVLLSFGCASANGLFNMDELALRAMWMPTLDLRVSVDQGTSPDGALPVRTGDPVACIGAEDITGPDAQAYLCGPPGLIAAAHAHLVRLGVTPANIHAEQFVASS